MKIIFFFKLILLSAVVLFPRPIQARVLQSFADIAEQAIPGVVNIRTTSYVSRDPSQDINQFFQYFLNGQIPKGSATTQSLGSGVIIDNKGHILTNHHVIKGASVIEVLFAQSKKKLQAKVVGTDPLTDLALLRVNTAGLNLHPLDLGDSESLRIGDIILAIGYPFGYSHTVTSGIISAKGRVLGTGPYDNFLQTDASIHPGNSGGPLLDIRGRVVGINTAVSAQGHGIGFAIPINMARNVTRDLLKFGKVKRPWMGIVGKNILSLDDVENMDDPSGIYGVIVANLIVDAPANRAGLKIGDLIMGLDKEKVLDMNHLQKLLSEKSPSDSVRLKVYRRGKGLMYLNLGLEETPKAEDLPIEKDLF